MSREKSSTVKYDAMEKLHVMILRLDLQQLHVCTLQYSVVAVAFTQSFYMFTLYSH